MAESFLMLYDRYFDDVYRYVYSKTGNRWDTDDLVSEIFTKAFEKFPAVAGDPKAWLFTVARNLAIDFYRGRGRKPALLGSEEPPGEDVKWDDQLIKTEETRCLKMALDSLPEEGREIIRLRYFANLKHRQIAGILQKNEGAVKMRIRRVLDELREMVDKCLNA